MLIPREEEPQIQVPMADVSLVFPVPSQKRWKQNWYSPWRKNDLQYQRCGVCVFHIYEGQAMLIVQFYVEKM